MLTQRTLPWVAWAAAGSDKIAAVAKKTLSGSIDEMARARELRLAADRSVSMSERLERLHFLCKQMSALKGAAAGRR